MIFFLYNGLYFNAIIILPIKIYWEELIGKKSKSWQTVISAAYPLDSIIEEAKEGYSSLSCSIKEVFIKVVCKLSGGHLGIFWAGMCRPGVQIGTSF